KDKILVRVFYIRYIYISQAYLMDSFKEIEYFMESSLSVAFRSKSIDCTTNGNYNDILDTIKNNDENSEIETIAQDSKDDSIINACNNPNFIEKIKTRLLSYLPIWTDVCVHSLKDLVKSLPLFRVVTPITTATTI
ncbi:hypothetical protein ALC56_15309, partial [Trachymyrmex septentrionalis]